MPYFSVLTSEEHVSFEKGLVIRNRPREKKGRCPGKKGGPLYFLVASNEASIPRP
jgi:hypothetical protein